jgi:protein-S-isoprenylcysteine O-methyltransferase Ste14
VGLTLIATEPLPFAGESDWDLLLDFVGLALAFAGQALRVLVIGLAYIKRGGRKKTITADRLVCDGVFAHSRNPLYVGNILLVTGLLLIWNSPLAYAVVLSIVVVSFISIVRAEETFLRGRFGAEYEEYCARVNRFVPDFRGFGQTLERFEFDWKRVVRKEYGTTFAWTSIALALIVLEKVIWEGAHAAAHRALVASAVWLCLLGLYLLARWLKKSHRIDSPD